MDDIHLYKGVLFFVRNASEEQVGRFLDALYEVYPAPINYFIKDITCTERRVAFHNASFYNRDFETIIKEYQDILTDGGIVREMSFQGEEMGIHFYTIMNGKLVICGVKVMPNFIWKEV